MYGNTKFTAWRGSETDKGVYRYSDEDRPEAMVSESVATGSFVVRITADDVKVNNWRDLCGFNYLGVLCVEGVGVTV